MNQENTQKHKLKVEINPDDDFSVNGENYSFIFIVNVMNGETNHNALLKHVKFLNFKIIHSEYKLQYFLNNVLKAKKFKEELNDTGFAEYGGNMSITASLIED